MIFEISGKIFSKGQYQKKKKKGHLLLLCPAWNGQIPPVYINLKEKNIHI